MVSCVRLHGTMKMNGTMERTMIMYVIMRVKAMRVYGTLNARAIRVYGIMRMKAM